MSLVRPFMARSNSRRASSILC